MYTNDVNSTLSYEITTSTDVSDCRKESSRNTCIYAKMAGLSGQPMHLIAVS